VVDNIWPHAGHRGTVQRSERFGRPPPGNSDGDEGNGEAPAGQLLGMGEDPLGVTNAD
jgi:hypothetical protein